eukprot:EG_transcript_2083
MSDPLDRVLKRTLAQAEDGKPFCGKWNFRDNLRSVACSHDDASAWCRTSRDSTTVTRQTFPAGGRHSVRLRIVAADLAGPFAVGAVLDRQDLSGCGDHYLGKVALAGSVGLVFTRRGARQEGRFMSMGMAIGPPTPAVAPGSTVAMTVAGGLLTITVDGVELPPAAVLLEGNCRFAVSLCHTGQMVEILPVNQPTTPLGEGGGPATGQNDAAVKSPAAGGDWCSIMGHRVLMRRAETIQGIVPPADAVRLAPLASKQGTVTRYDATDRMCLVEFSSSESHWVPRATFNVALGGGKYTRWHVGTRVVRGKTWQWGDQDGGVGNVGIVTEVDLDGPENVRVCWPIGPNRFNNANYRQTDLWYAQGQRPRSQSPGPSDTTMNRTGADSAIASSEGRERCTIAGYRIRMRKADEIQNAVPPPEVPRLTPLALKTGTVKRYDAAEERYLVEFGGADSHWVPRSCFNVALGGDRFTRWHVGARVVRGETWQWGDQDGGAGTVGVVTEVDHQSPDWVKVSWRRGPNKVRTADYRQTDLAPAPPAGQGAGGSRPPSQTPGPPVPPSPALAPTPAPVAGISFAPSADLEALLASLHLSPYAISLARAGYNSVEALALASKEDLLRHGVLEPQAILLVKRLRERTAPAGGAAPASSSNPQRKRHRESPTFITQVGANFLDLVHSINYSRDDVFMNLWEYAERKGLGSPDVEGFSNRLQHHSGDPNQITKALLWLYSLESWVYQECNRACREDNKEDLACFMPFIKALLVGMPRCNDLLLTTLLQPADQSITLYRRTTLQPNHLQLYVEKQRFIWSGFTSTSLQDSAVIFGVHLFVITVPRTFCNKLIHLDGVSAFPNEREILLPCNLGFVVTHTETLPSPTTRVKIHIKMQFEVKCV